MENWKEYRKQYDATAREIVSKMTLREKVSLMSGRLTREEIRSHILNRKKTHYNETPYWAGGFAEENIMPVLFVDGSRGVVCDRGKYTGFPVVALRGAAFDRELEYEIGQAIGKEVILAGGNLFGGCCLNLPYHPGWGRHQESYGEDSYLIGELGAELVKGVQSVGVIACIKHFAFNSMENNRLNVNIICDKKAEQEVYLPHFRKCIDAGAGVVMTAYNRYLGVMCGQNDYLIRHVLKETWGFDGFVISDFTWGINDTVEAARSGMDVEMPHTYYYGDRLVNALENGSVSKECVDEAAVRIVRTMLAHGDTILSKREDIKREKNLFKNHALLALKAAREGIVLLKNEDLSGQEILPLKCTGKNKKIVLLGNLSQEDNLGDHGSSRTYPPYVVHAADGIWKCLNGAELIIYTGNHAGHCKRLAKEADAVIIVAGNSYKEEGEHIKADETMPPDSMVGGDRIHSLSLPEEHKKIIHAVGEVRKDAILVLTGGGPIVLSEELPEVGAVLMQFYPGMEGGTALGEILFGKISPSGRLPFTIPKTETDLPEIDWEANEQIYGYYHGYTWFAKNKREPEFPFGYGLSYTTFHYSGLTAAVDDDKLIADVTVLNTGKREAEHSVLLFVSSPKSKETLQTEQAADTESLLKGFDRINLRPGESKRVRIECPLKELQQIDAASETWRLEMGEYTVSIGELNTRVTIQ